MRCGPSSYGIASADPRHVGHEEWCTGTVVWNPSRRPTGMRSYAGSVQSPLLTTDRPLPRSTQTRPSPYANWWVDFGSPFVAGGWASARCRRRSSPPRGRHPTRHARRRLLRFTAMASDVRSATKTQPGRFRWPTVARRSVTRCRARGYAATGDGLDGDSEHPHGMASHRHRRGTRTDQHLGSHAVMHP